MAGMTSLAGLLIANTASANLLTNPGFETGDFTGWQVLNAGVATVQTPDNGPSAAGTHNAFMDNQFVANNLALKQTTPNGSVGAGVLVNYSFDLKAGINANGGVEFVHIFDQNSVGGVIGQGPGLLGPLLLGPPDGLWHTFSGSFTTLPGTDHLTIQFEAPTGAVIGSVSSMKVDNADLHQDVVVPAEGASWGRVKGLYR